VLVGYAKVTRDLTERRAAEEELRRSDERFRVLIESVLDYGIVTLDLNGTVTSWNEGAGRISGYDASEIIGRHFSTFYAAEDLAVGQPETELRVATAEGRFEDEGWRIRKDGSRFWANIIMTALRDPSGRLIGFAKITRDLTERRAMNERLLVDARRIAAEEAARAAAEDRNRELGELLGQLRTQTQELERQRAVAQTANRAKSEFLAAMSHELRTPLNAIGGYIDLLVMGVRGPVTSDQATDLDRMRRSQQHLLGIINDLLNYARVEAGQVTYQMTDVAIADVVATAGEMAIALAAARRISFAATEVEPLLTAYADRAKLDQILINLVSNAVKFTGPGGRISIAARREAGRIVIEVNDTGIGIAQEMLETIFEPFVQVGRSLTNPGEGTGLGLAISRDLARAMGGDLLARSRIGAGSTFTVLLVPGGASRQP
jgi:PAS domain S-box-containing protein